MNKFDLFNSFLHTSTYFYTIEIGLDSTYSYVSPNYDRNFSFGKGTLRGQHYTVTLHPDDISICETVGAKCFSEPNFLFPATLRKHDGKGGFIVTQWEMQANLHEDGTPLSIFCIGYNITELINTRGRLDKAALKLTEISFVQSHVVRKPLANILGITKLFETADTKEEYKHLADLLFRSASEFDSIIRDISNNEI